MDIYFNNGEKKMPLRKYILNMAMSGESLLFSLLFFFSKNDE